MLAIKVLVFTLFGCLMLGSGVAGAAQSAGPPLWSVGDYWQYAYAPPAQVTTALEATTHAVSYLMVGSANVYGRGYNVLFTALETVQGPLPQLQLAPQNALWDGGIVPIVEVGFPLEPLQVWTRQAVIGDHTLTLSAQVLGVETVNVPAGAFAAYHIQYKEDGHWFAELWYSPLARSFVRRCNILAPAFRDFARSDLPTVRAGTFALQQAWRFPPEAALEQMFAALRQSAQSGRADLVLPVLQQLIEYGIATAQASALKEALLRGH